MSLRLNIVKCIESAVSSDEAARRVCGMLHDLDLASPGNGWYDDDPDMAADLNRAWKAWREVEDGRPYDEESEIREAVERALAVLRQTDAERDARGGA